MYIYVLSCVLYEIDISVCMYKALVCIYLGCIYNNQMSLKSTKQFEAVIVKNEVIPIVLFIQYIVYILN